MKNATRLFASTFGAIMALAGMEHGIGEILQGNVAPGGLMIQSWPESAFFHNLAGEPAMTVLPDLLLTGVLAVIVSLALLIWSVHVCPAEVRRVGDDRPVNPLAAGGWGDFPAHLWNLDWRDRHPD